MKTKGRGVPKGKHSYAASGGRGRQGKMKKQPKMPLDGGPPHKKTKKPPGNP